MYKTEQTPHYPDQERTYNQRQALKFILDYYYKNDPFSGGVDEYWLLYLEQFEILSKEGESDDVTVRKHLVYTIKPCIRSYQCYQQLTKIHEISWKMLKSLFFKALPLSSQT